MTKTILIVDDSRLTRSIIKNAVTAAGFHVVAEGKNGSEGVELYKKHKPDLVTMDLTMPVFGGMESLREIMACNPQAKVLVVTALNQRLLVNDALLAGAKGMIAKPFQPFELVKIITGLLGDPGKETSVELSPEEIEDIRELGNIGVGNAASRLSDLIDQRCLVDIPTVGCVTVAGIRALLDMENSFAVALHIKILGDIPAVMIVITKKVHAQLLVSYLTRKMPEAAEKDMSAQVLMALKHLGELLTAAFSDAIGQFLSTKARYAVPDIFVDSWSSELEGLLGHFGSSQEQMLVIRSSFFSPEKSYEGRFIYILDRNSQRMVTRRLRLMLMGGGSAENTA